jgi:hypothetical protein
MTTKYERLGPPPIEPLSDIAWSRVERGLWAELDTDNAPTPARSRRWIWLVAPAMAVAAMIAIVLATHTAGTPTTTFFGDDPTQLVTEAAPSSLSIGDIHLTLDPYSAISMRHESDAPTATLERGAAWFTVAPRADRPAFTVVAGDTTVRVIGTRFRVSRSAEYVTVQVEHGRVDVRSHGVGAEVEAGQTWSSQTPNVVTTSIQTATAEVPAKNASKHVAPDAISSPVDKPAVELPSGRTLPRTKPTGDKPVIVKATTDKPVTEKPVTPDVDKGKPAADPNDTEFNRLATLERRDPTAAINGYIALSGRDPRWAEQALYAAARLAADQRPTRAAGLLEIFLGRFPNSRNADDARVLLARIKGATR